MLSLTEIKKFYPENLHKFDDFMLREYLQYKILEIIFESKYSDKLCFLGGTCLRIIHNSTRFSEDLDFDNFNLTIDDFNNISEIIKNELTKQAYQVEIKNIYKGAFHCYIKFPGLLFNENLSAHKESKILIQLDTEAQNFVFEPQQVFLNKFDVFTNINTTPIDILLAQKYYALINRNRKKGRDFFDIVFLHKTTKPNFEYLNQKIGISNANDLLNKVLIELKNIDLKEMSEDVKPFLFNSTDIKKILHFKNYIIQELKS